MWGSAKVREINAVVRAADGRNVYVSFGGGSKRRVTKARVRGGRFEVYCLLGGEWIGAQGTTITIE